MARICQRMNNKNDENVVKTLRPLASNYCSFSAILQPEHNKRVPDNDSKVIMCQMQFLNINSLHGERAGSFINLCLSPERCE